MHLYTLQNVINVVKFSSFMMIFFMEAYIQDTETLIHIQRETIENECITFKIYIGYKRRVLFHYIVINF